MAIIILRTNPLYFKQRAAIEMAKGLRILYALVSRRVSRNPVRIRAFPDSKGAWGLTIIGC
jgi:hypothetical protein